MASGCCVSTAGAAVLFGEFFAVGQGDQGVCKYWGCGSPKAACSSSWRGVLSLKSSATHDVGNALVSIIDHDGQLVSPQSIGPAQEKNHRKPGPDAGFAGLGGDPASARAMG